MTSSYGYQRPLSNEEELYLQNQALRAELQRREDAKQGVREAIGGGLATGLGLGAVAAGAFGLASALSPAQRAKMGRNLSSTVDLSKQRENIKDLSAKGIEAVENIRQTVADVVRPSQPAPKTYGERVAQSQENARQARTERPQGISVRDLNAVLRSIPEPTAAELEGALAAPRMFAYRPKGGIQDLATDPSFADQLITDPKTGEIFRRGQSPESFKETYVSLRPALTGQKTDLPQSRTPGTFTEFSQQASALEKQANTIQAAAETDFGPQSYLQSEGYIAADNLVDQHQARVLGRIDQFANAANPAEDQATGRVKMALQRNEDVNLAAVEMAEDTVDSQIAKAAQGDPTVASVTDLDSAINQAASTLPDGLPLDQAERLPKDPWSGSATVPGPQRSIASSIETKLLPSAAVSPREKSQQFLQQRFEELGAVVPSPTRRERILSADPALAEAYELYASTGDPSVLSRLSEAPSSPINVTLREQSEFVSPEVATKSLYKPGVYPEYVGDLIEKDIELTNQISSLSQEKLNIAARQKELGEQELMLKNAMAQEPVERDAYSRMLGKVKYEQQNLPSPESLNVDIGDAMAERDFTLIMAEKKKKDKKWIQGMDMKEGAFTAKAKKRGITTAQLQENVLANPEKYDEKTVKQANLRKTLVGLKKKKKAKE
jgi:hypothetical protein